MVKKTLYHIHRKGNMDHIWTTGSQILVDNNFVSLYYVGLLNDENSLINRYSENYDIDYIIAMMEEMTYKNLVEDDMKKEFNKILKGYYFLRREKALEEGRKLFNPTAPCRFHSIFLSNKIDLYYWEKIFGGCSFNRFLVEVEGNIFMSSDRFFPDETLLFDNQVERSKEYWVRKTKSLIRNEFIFQESAKILK